jgi:hypothetical protein
MNARDFRSYAQLFSLPHKTTNKIFVFFCLSFSSIAFAAEWSAKANLNQQVGYNDNVRLQKNHQGSMELIIKPTVFIARKSDKFELQGSASYGIQRFFSMKSLNKPIQNYTASAIYNLERTRWEIDANFNSQLTLNNAGQNAGGFSSNAVQTHLSVSPSVSYQLTELDSLTLSSGYSKTSSSLNNYQYQNLNLAWQRKWTERFSTSLSPFYSNYTSQTTSSDNKTTTYGVNASTDYSLSEKWKINAAIGGFLVVMETDLPNNVIEKNSSQGFLSNGGIDYQGENFAARLGFSRSLRPSNQGQLTTQNAINLNLNYKITERLDTVFTGNYQQNNSVTGNNNNMNRDYINLQLGLNWKFSQDLLISGQYNYRSQNSTGVQTQSGESNLFMLSFNYNWPGINLSR